MRKIEEDGVETTFYEEDGKLFVAVWFANTLLSKTEVSPDKIKSKLVNTFEEKVIETMRLGETRAFNDSLKNLDMLSAYQTNIFMLNLHPDVIEDKRVRDLLYSVSQELHDKNE